MGGPVLIPGQRQRSLRLVERFTDVQGSMRVKHAAVAENALQRAADHRGVQHLMQLGNTRQHVVAHG